MPDKSKQSLVIANIGKRKHPQYDECVRLWDFLLASYRGGLGMQGRSGMTPDQVRNLKPSGYYAGLFRFKRENIDDYLIRVAQTPYRPYVRKIIKAFANYVTKDEPEREGVESMKDFILNCDRKGTSLTNVTQSELALQAALGEINILIDMPSIDRPMFTQYDVNLAGLKPYSVVIMPQSIIDWSVNVNGKYDWVIIESTYFENDLSADNAVVRKYRTFWDDKIWQIYQEGDSKKKSEKKFELLKEGPHPCGECPVIRVSAEDVDNAAVTPESWAYDLFDLNRAIYSLDADNLANIHMQTHGQMIIPRSGVNTDEDVKIATISEAWTETPEERGITRFEQPTGAESVTIRDSIADLKREMYNVAGLMHRTDTRAAETAESKAWDFQEINGFLAQFARTADWAEQEKIRLAAKWLGKTIDPKVTYPKDYAIEDIEKTTAAILDLKSIGFSSETGRKAVVKKVFKALLPEADQALMTEIEREIDESEERNPLLELANAGGFGENNQEEMMAKGEMQDEVVNS